MSVTVYFLKKIFFLPPSFLKIYFFSIKSEKNIEFAELWEKRFLGELQLILGKKYETELKKLPSTLAEPSLVNLYILYLS